MGNVAKNKLTIRPLAGGWFFLSGYFSGRRIRLKSRSAEELHAKKAEMEQQLAALDGPRQVLRMTWLSEEQLRDAEAAVRRAGGRTLLDCVEASDRVMVAGEPVKLVTAATEWAAHLESRRRFARTLEKNKQRVASFLRTLPASFETVQQVTPEHVEAFAFRKDAADYTRLTDARVLRAWGAFWLRRRWVKVSPFASLDLKDMASGARAAELPRILSPRQAHALLDAAKTRDGGALAPYVALATWCFLRHAEVLRVTAADLRLDAERPFVEVRPRKRGTVSYRTVAIPACVLPVLKKWVAELEPKKEGEPDATIPWGTVRFASIRAAAGLAKLGGVKNKKRAVTSAVWQPNILRHTGLSYFYAKTGDIRETCRQAGNSSETAFAHYVNLPRAGEAERFYSISPAGPALAAGR